MSANVETMFYVREKPWHGLGTMVQEAPTSADALRLAGLDWTVEARDMWLNGGYEPIPGYKANVRSSDNKVLGVVSDKYRIVQNADTPIADRRRCEPKAIQSAVRRAAKGAWLTNPEYVQQLAGYPLTGCPSAVQFIEMLYNALVRAA